MADNNRHCVTAFTSIAKGERYEKIACIDQKICVTCGVCMNTYPKGVISIYKGYYARVETEKCVGCGLCAKACSAGCIQLQERKHEEKALV